MAKKSDKISDCENPDPGNSSEYEKVTMEDVKAGGSFYLIMFDGSDAWITPDKVILPGKDKPSEFELILKHCHVEEQLSFYYFGGKEKIIVTTGKKVKQIIRMA